MGVLNLTPDSFSDGGRYPDLQAALAASRRLIQEGADILDVGGESTRPGASPPTLDEELDRVIPLIERLRTETPHPVSIDTRRPAVARAAMTAGVSIWNDVSGLRADGALDLAAELGCEVVIMHMQGEPQTMQRRPSYGDVVEDVLEYLDKRTSAALAAGVRPHNILIDPGLGFGKTAEHTLRLLSALRRFTADGRRVVLGASRKRFLMTVDPSAVEPLDRLGGSIACVLEAASAGCEVVRVHDVRETAQALSLWRAVAARQSVGDENDHQEQGAGADAIEGEWV